MSHSYITYTLGGLVCAFSEEKISYQPEVTADVKDLVVSLGIKL